MTPSTADKQWQQISCHCTKVFQYEITRYLEEANALSITFQDAGDTPVLEPLPGETPLWNDLILTALFAGEDDLSTLLVSLENKQKNGKLIAFSLKFLKIKRGSGHGWMILSRCNLVKIYGFTPVGASILTMAVPKLA